MAISRASSVGRFSEPRRRRKATFCQTGNESNRAAPLKQHAKTRQKNASRSPLLASLLST